VAGHPLPLLRVPGGTATEIGAPARPLGIDAGAGFGEVQVELSAGSTLVLYTDGVTEARDDAGRQFGDDGLLRVLDGDDCQTAAATVAAVHAAVEHHLNGSRHGADDLAVLALRC
jgi:serine phosphatase RsbU (regulator of sigma subunit)